MSNAIENDSPQDGDATEEAQRSARVRDLVGEWLSLNEIADRTGRSLNQARKLLSDREVIGARVLPGGVHVPAAFFEGSDPLPALKGTVTVLVDGGMSDLEAIEWLFTADESFPAPGTPLDNLRAGFKTEMRRRAMELAF